MRALLPYLLSVLVLPVYIVCLALSWYCNPGPV